MASRSLNKVMLIGNLTRDPEIRYTGSGAAMCSMGLATNRTWKSADGELKEEAEFHNLVAWNKMAEICYQILAKGMKVFFEGELRTRKWEDESGENKYRTEIKVNDMMLLDSRGKSGIGGGQTAEPTQEVTVEEVEATAAGTSADTVADKGESSKTAKKAVKSSKAGKPAVADKKSEKPAEDDILDDNLPF